MFLMIVVIWFRLLVEIVNFKVINRWLVFNFKFCKVVLFVMLLYFNVFFEY